MTMAEGKQRVTIALKDPAQRDSTGSCASSACCASVVLLDLQAISESLEVCELTGLHCCELWSGNGAAKTGATKAVCLLSVQADAIAAEI